MRNFKLTIQYDGSRYHGFQIQPEAITIQKAVEDTLSSITKEDIHINGCSRTDAGVHAVMYVCSFFTDFRIPPERLPIVLNAKLPNDIIALECTEVPMDFHARFDTSCKTYRYRINTEPNPQVFTRNFEWQLKKTLDVINMKKASKYIVGTHDFACFMTSGSDVQSTLRTVFDLNIVENNSYVEIYIKADGYLYNMVRIITGTLVNVGLGKIRPEELENIIASKSRENAGPTAPPQGLALYKVEY